MWTFIIIYLNLIRQVYSNNTPIFFTKIQKYNGMVALKINNNSLTFFELVVENDRAFPLDWVYLIFME